MNLIDNCVSATLSADPHVAHTISLSGKLLAERTGAVLYTLDARMRTFKGGENALILCKEELMAFNYGINPQLIPLPVVTVETEQVISRSLTTYNGNVLTTSGSGMFNPGEYLEIGNKLYQVISQVDDTITVNQDLIHDGVDINTGEDIRVKMIVSPPSVTYHANGSAEIGQLQFKEVI